MRKLATRGSLGALAFAICVVVLVASAIEAVPRFGGEIFRVSAILWLIAFLLFTLSWFWQERNDRQTSYAEIVAGSALVASFFVVIALSVVSVATALYWIH